MKHPVTYIFLMNAFLLGFATSPLKAEILRTDIFDLPPYAYKEDEKYTGILYDITQLIIAESKIKTEIRISPLARALENLSNGRSDWSIIFRSSWTSQNFEPSALVISGINGVVLPIKGIVLETYHDLKEVPIATPRGMILGHFFDNDETLHKIQTTDYQQSAKLMHAGRAKAMAGVEIALQIEAREAGFAPEDLGKPLILNTSSFWLHFTSDRITPHQKLKLKSTVSRLRKSGHFQKIFDSYRTYK